MRFNLANAAVALLPLFAAGANAQHVDIFVWDNGGKVGVGQFDFDNLGASDTRVHLARFNTLYSVDQPGFTSFSGPDALPGGEQLTWDFLPITVDSGPHAGYESTLLYWDGVGTDPVFGPTPTDEYVFSLFGVTGPGRADGGSEVAPGGVIDTTPPNGAIHQHLFYFLDDNGDELNTTLPEAGIYVVSLRLAIGDLEPSDPVFMVWATPEQSVLPAIRHAAAWVNQRVDTLFVEPLDGDFNGDGFVDTADYTVWRDGLGTTYELSQYDIWKDNYGAGGSSSSTALAVPEPSGLLVLIAATSGLLARSRSAFFVGV